MSSIENHSIVGVTSILKLAGKRRDALRFCPRICGNNRATGLALVSPLTGKRKAHPFALPANVGGWTEGCR
jgi:hypothetical protein